MIIVKTEVTQEQLEVIRTESTRLAEMGYKVPDIHIQSLADDVAGYAPSDIYINPHNRMNKNLNFLGHCVRHEIGHCNEPELELDIWADEVKDWTQIHQESEEWANSFADGTK